MIPFRFLLVVLAVALLVPAASLHAQSRARTATNSSSYGTSRTNTNRTGASQGAYGSSGGVRQYPSNTLLGDAIIQIDPESRSLIVVTDEETHREISKVVDNLDHPKPQVLIKVVFVEVSLDKNLDVGLEGTYTFNLHNNGLFSGSNSATVSGSAQSVSSVLGNGGSSLQTLFGLAQQSNGSFVRLASDNWTATLHALAEHGNLHVLSRPSIMARNNQEAVIVVGQEMPFVTNSQITNTGQTLNTIQYRDVGIILRVTPFISSDRSVEMIVAPEISSISNQTIAITNGVNAPVINKRSAETVVVTPNGTTIVIGGLMQKQETSTIQKIPILGDIPILGYPFRHTVKGETRSELLIFLTPYIVENTRRLKELTNCAADPADLKRNGFPADQILNDIEDFKLPCGDPDPKSAPTPTATHSTKKKRQQ